MKPNYVTISASAILIFLVSFSSICQGQVLKPAQRQPGPSYAGPQVQMARMPDLVIVSVSGVPDEITRTDRFSPGPGGRIFLITMTVKNIGNEDAWFPPYTWFMGGPSSNPGTYLLVNGQGSTTISQYPKYMVIRPGETRTENIAGEIKCIRGDPLEVRFQVDPQNRVVERNEGNNEWKKLVSNRAVTGQDQKPDLVIDSISFGPPNPTHYDRVMITVHLSNRGAGPAIFCDRERTWIARFDLPGLSEGGDAGERVVKPNEAFGGGFYIVEPNTLRRGCYRVFVIVDPDKVISETDENNNTKIAYLPMDGGDCSQLIAEDKRPKPGTIQKLPYQQPLPPGVSPVQKLR